MLRWRRKLESGGDWYAQARDGAWSRWDQLASDWVAAPDGPPGGAAPLEPESSGVYLAPARHVTDSVAWGYITTFLGVTTPAFFALLIAIAVAAVFTFVWNGFLAPWWGDYIEPQKVLWPTLVGVLTFCVFLSGGITINRAGGTGSFALAALVVGGGAVATLFVVAAMTGLGPIQVLTSRNTVFAAFMIGLSWAGVSLRRWLAEV